MNEHCFVSSFLLFLFYRWVNKQQQNPTTGWIAASLVWILKIKAIGLKKFDYFCLFTHLSNVLFKLKICLEKPLRTHWKHCDKLQMLPDSQNQNPECPLQTEHWISEQIRLVLICTLQSLIVLHFLFVCFCFLFLFLFEVGPHYVALAALDLIM